jgi:hypothetical protein
VEKLLIVENINVHVPKFQDIVFYPFSNIGMEPLICTSDVCKYICVFVDYFPSSYPTAIESCYMRDLVEFAQTNKVDRFVISFGNEEPISLLIEDYIEAARPT